VSEAGEAGADTRTPAQIEADIRRRRERLAQALDEIGVRVHPKTIAGDAKARMAAGVNHSVARVFAGAERAAYGMKGQFVAPNGKPRLARIVPVALVVVGVVGLLATGSHRRRGVR
jgi:hypothetical protein